MALDAAPSDPAARLTALRVLADISKRELASLARMSEAGLRHFVSGKHQGIDLTLAGRLAAVLGVTLDFLAHGTGPEPTVEQVQAAVTAAKAARDAAAVSGAAA